MARKLNKAHATAPTTLPRGNGTTSHNHNHEDEPSHALNDSLPLPRLVVFDLDYTLWPLWVDTHVSPPLRAAPGSHGLRAVDRIGDSFALYPEVPGVLAALRRAGVRVGAASRTHAPDLARELLRLLWVVPPEDAGGGARGENDRPRRAWDVFDAGLEIYPGSKLRHMEALARRTGIPYSDMLFFDDESRNSEVERLGVTMCLVPDGVTWEELERGIQMWRARRGIA